LKNRALKIISQVMNIPVERLNEDSSPDTVENWDSLQHMNLILALEEEFDIAFSDEEIMKMLSVKIILETLKKKSLTS
jgi:acyl carrier protein